jgi:hypothetical protein
MSHTPTNAGAVPPIAPRSIETFTDWRAWLAHQSFRDAHPVTAPPRPKRGISQANLMRLQAQRLHIAHNIPTLMPHRVAAAFEEMKKTIDAGLFNERPGVNAGVALSAPSAIGKTTLARETGRWVEHNLASLQDVVPNFQSRAISEPIPVAYVRMPPKVTLKGLCQRIAAYYGEGGITDRTTEENLVKRIHRLVAECDTRVMFIDDVTRVRLGREADVEAINLFRDLLEASVVFVLIGIDIENSGLLTHSLDSHRNQLMGQMRRFDVVPLTPFAYDTADDIAEWRTYLAELQNHLPLWKLAPGTLADNLDDLLFHHTQGVIGALHHLVGAATAAAIRDGSETLNRRSINQAANSHQSRLHELLTADDRSGTTPPVKRTRKSRNNTYSQRAAS